MYGDHGRSCALHEEGLPPLVHVQVNIVGKQTIGRQLMSVESEDDFRSTIGRLIFLQGLFLEIIYAQFPFSNSFKYEHLWYMHMYMYIDWRSTLSCVWGCMRAKNWDTEAQTRNETSRFTAISYVLRLSHLWFSSCLGIQIRIPLFLFSYVENETINRKEGRRKTRIRRMREDRNKQWGNGSVLFDYQCLHSIGYHY